MLGGENEAPVEVVAQRDFVRLEKEYFADECVRMNIILVSLLMISLFGFIIWSKYVE